MKKTEIDIDDQDLEDIGQSTYTATWSNTSYNSSARTITSTLTLSEEPGSGFSIGDDFRVEKYDNQRWIEDTNWTLSYQTPPVFGSFTQTALYEDTAYDETIRATGNPTPTITSAVTSGILPGNMTLSGPRLYSTGNPQIIQDAGTTFTITFTASSTSGTRTQMVNFTIAPNRLPVFDDISFSDVILIENTAYDKTFTATGVPTPTITSSVTFGSLPNGLTLSGARLSGTPRDIPDTGSTFSITFTATSGTNTVNKVVGFFVNNVAPSVPANTYTAPSFNTFTPTALTIGTPTNQTITASGNPTPVITSTTNLPSKIKVFYVRRNTSIAVTSQQKTNIDTLVKGSRKFFSDQMNARGYGRQTFDLITDASGNVIVNDITKSEYYTLKTANSPSEGSSSGTYDLFFCDFPSSDDASTRNIAAAGLALSGQNASIYYQERFAWPQNTVSHELGHVFYLTHRHAGDNTLNIMHPRGGSIRNTLSAASAKFLNDRGYFYTIRGSVPNGLTLSGATLSGTPAAGTAGTFSILFTATSDVGTVRRLVTFTIGT